MLELLFNLDEAQDIYAATKGSDNVTMSMDYDDYKKNHDAISKLKYKRRTKEAVIDLIQKLRPLREK
ncbi:hypothetical protein [uncultured Mitsuokella sp.]|uniref:hypothetical protein n=1 Tax=uncultured Mitsuokella sp. TaxID=453120 RepID=UPI0025E4CCC9|nr:hypothetical protein [uncultured Mitsuokella sp.]